MAEGGPWSRCPLKAATGFRRSLPTYILESKGLQNPGVRPSTGLVGYYPIVLRDKIWDGQQGPLRS